MEATAKYDFVATADEELSFRKGQCLRVLQTSGNWYKAELNDVQGLVPKNFLSINLPSWYQEDISRAGAEVRLMSQPVGAFLIRGSKNVDLGHFSISVRHPADVQHFKVLRDSRGQYYIWSEKFPSLNQMVDYYKKNSVSKEVPLFLREAEQQQKRSQSRPPVPHPVHSPQRPDWNPVPAPRQRKDSPMQVRALYRFRAQETDELEFNAGDIIKVLECSHQAWWKGELRGKIGLFPSSYTKPF